MSILYLVQQVFLFLLLSIIITLIHELGHVEFLKKYTKKDIKIWFDKKNLSFNVGAEEDYDELTNEQLINVYKMGIYYGIIPLFISYFILNPLFFMLLVLSYFFGSYSDLKNMYKVTKKAKLSI
jgi:hypothetical protein